jgi:hypothetical protein
MVRSKLVNELMSGINEGEHPPKGYKETTTKERYAWNQFLKFVNSKGLTGSAELDKKDKSIGNALLDEFNSANPQLFISKESIPTFQYENAALRKKGQFPELDSTSSLMVYKQLPDKYKKQEVSPIDGWIGSKTSSLAYPEFVVYGDSYGNQKMDFKSNYLDFLKKDNPDIKSKYVGNKILAMKKS